MLADVRASNGCRPAWGWSMKAAALIAVSLGICIGSVEPSSASLAGTYAILEAPADTVLCSGATYTFRVAIYNCGDGENIEFVFLTFPTDWIIDVASAGFDSHGHDWTFEVDEYGDWSLRWFVHPGDEYFTSGQVGDFWVDATVGSRLGPAGVHWLVYGDYLFQPQGPHEADGTFPVVVLGTTPAAGCTWTSIKNLFR
jgi:hypothetical protein